MPPLSNNPDNFWDLLEASRLVPAEVIDSFRNNGSASSEQARAALVERKLLSPWQLKVLESGESGPFYLASYLLLDQIGTGPLAGSFAARHVPSGHLTLLEFETASPQAIAATVSWQEIQQRASLVSRVHHPHLLEVFEAVSLPDYGFVANEFPSGKSLAQLLPDGKKSGSQQTARLIAQIASAVQSIHDAGTFHGNIDLNNLWLVTKNSASLRMPFWSTPATVWNAATSEPGPATDNFHLACTTIRLWTGQAISLDRGADPASAQAENLAGEKMPEPIKKMICKMLDENPAERPAAGEISQILMRASGIESFEEAEPAETLLIMRESIQRFNSGASGKPVIRPAGIEIETSPSSIRKDLPQLSGVADSKSIRTKSRKNPWPKWLAAAASFGLLTFVIFWFQPVDDTSVGLGTPTNDNNQLVQNVAIAGPDETETPVVTNPDAVIAQKVIPDDGKSLWESPTTGSRLDLAWLPPAPRMIFSIRASRLFSSEEGMRLVQAGGAGLESIIADFQSRTGLEPAEVSELLVGLYIDEDPLKYRSVFVTHLKQPALPEKLQTELSLQPAADDEEAKSEFGLFFQRNGGDVFAVIDSSGETPSISTLVFGPADLIGESVAAGGKPALDGPLSRLASMADDDRTINALFVPAALFNDAGQALVGKTWGPITSRLRTEFDETLRAGLISLHLDDESYLELMLDHSVDLRPEKALEKLDGQLAFFKTELAQKIAAVPSSPWWERVRLQMDNMIYEVYRNVRTGIENEVVVANCWLPSTAPHNLIGSSKIALSFASGIPYTATTAKPAVTISTLEQLLELPRDLEVTTNPDLGLLLQGIETEINDQYNSLPFKFRIRMEGTDLVKQGITQNQRPGNFAITAKPLSEILTEIMFRANPKKTATGPSDPLCELVWALTEDPEQPGQKMVLVTTRTAATEREITLPAEFQPVVDSGK